MSDGKSKTQELGKELGKQWRLEVDFTAKDVITGLLKAKAICTTSTGEVEEKDVTVRAVYNSSAIPTGFVLDATSLFTQREN